MMKRNISWEIILAGLTFIGIGIYLLNNMNSSDADQSKWESRAYTSSAPSLPGAIVIDLQNLESLKNLEKLKNLKQLQNLEVEIKNLDQIIEQELQNNLQKDKLDSELKELKKELQKIEEADFRVKLKDQKLFINKNYNVGESQWTEISSGVFIFQSKFNPEDVQSLDFKSSFGNLNIVGNGSSDSDITLRATGDIDDPASIAEKLSIEKSIQNGKMTFAISAADGNNISDRMNLEATLSLPKTIALQAQTSGGHITASNLNNTQELNTSGGHITLSDLQGSTVAKTGGGHITSTAMGGDIKLITGGGHIKLQDVNGTLSAKTGGGHIEIQDARGSIAAKTSGGNISSTIISAQDQLRFSTSAGNVSLSIPSDLSADLDITGTSVDLDDIFDFDGNKSRGNINGTLNGGGLPIVINCGYGNVTINSNN